MTSGPTPLSPCVYGDTVAVLAGARVYLLNSTADGRSSIVTELCFVRTQSIGRLTLFSWNSVACYDETKHSYLNMADEVLASNQRLHDV